METQVGEGDRGGFVVFCCVFMVFYLILINNCGKPGGWGRRRRSTCWPGTRSGAWGDSTSILTIPMTMKQLRWRSRGEVEKSQRREEAAIKTVRASTQVTFHSFSGPQSLKAGEQEWQEIIQMINEIITENSDLGCFEFIQCFQTILMSDFKSITFLGKYILKFRQINFTFWTKLTICLNAIVNTKAF